MTDRPVLVKICGVRTLEGAQAGVDAGADLLGFICYPPARRYLAPEQIAAILQKLHRRSSVLTVGVFVNQSVAEMNAVAALCKLDLIQLSGDESAEGMRLLERPVIKAFRPGEQGLSFSCPPLAESGKGPHPLPLSAQERGLGVRSGLFAALLEPPAAGWGGAGQVGDWSIARSVTDLPSRPLMFLAGGLRPDNVAQAIAAVRPEGVDVSSGVETDGTQDIASIAAFVTAAKGVAT